MTGTVLVGIVGDYNPGKPSHIATDEALAHAAQVLGIILETEWLPTASLESNTEVVRRFDAVLGAPGSPYESFEGALAAIRLARTLGVPFIGTCGGFQHAAIEYARNVLGLANAGHAEYDPEAPDPFVTPLACSLIGESGRVEFRPGSKIHDIYNKTEAEEEYRCSFGLDDRRRRLLESGGLRVSGVDENGEARVLELPDHPFYIATLFVPQHHSSPGSSHPLILAFLRAALARCREDRPTRSAV